MTLSWTFFKELLILFIDNGQEEITFIHGKVLKRVLFLHKYDNPDTPYSSFIHGKVLKGVLFLHKYDNPDTPPYSSYLSPRFAANLTRTVLMRGVGLYIR